MLRVSRSNEELLSWGGNKMEGWAGGYYVKVITEEGLATKHIHLYTTNDNLRMYFQYINDEELEKRCAKKLAKMINAKYFKRYDSSFFKDKNEHYIIDLFTADFEKMKEVFKYKEVDDEKIFIIQSDLIKKIIEESKKEIEKEREEARRKAEEERKRKEKIQKMYEEIKEYLNKYNYKVVFDDYNNDIQVILKIDHFEERYTINIEEAYKILQNKELLQQIQKVQITLLEKRIRDLNSILETERRKIRELEDKIRELTRFIYDKDLEEEFYQYLLEKEIEKEKEEKMSEIRERYEEYFEEYKEEDGDY